MENSPNQETSRPIIQKKLPSQNHGAYGQQKISLVCWIQQPHHQLSRWFQKAKIYDK